MDSATEFARQISRNAVMAMTTEPLAEKDGCTTRTVDSSPSARLEYFIVGGCNIIWPLFDLSYQVISAGSLNASLFHHSYNAQRNSVINRHGGKVTFGQTLLLTPLIAAQSLSVSDGNPLTDTENSRARIHEVLSWKSSKNIEDLERFCLLAIEQSRLSNKRLGSTRTNYPNPRLSDKYDNFIAAAEEPEFSKLSITQEMVSGYQQSYALLDRWREYENSNLLTFVEDIFPMLNKQYGRFDVAADIIATAMHLILCEVGDEVVYT